MKAQILEGQGTSTYFVQKPTRVKVVSHDPTYAYNYVTACMLHEQFLYASKSALQSPFMYVHL